MSKQKPHENICHMTKLVLISVMLFSLTSKSKTFDFPIFGIPGIIAPIATVQVDINGVADQNRWLYDILFTQADRSNSPNESFKSFKVHLNDSYNLYPPPEMIRAQSLRTLAPGNRVKGTMGYVSNIFRKTYTYDIFKTSDGQLIMNVRVHLRGGTVADQQTFQQKIKLAEQIWNASRIGTDFKYSFLFDIVADKSQAHYSVAVADKTRGPYDTVWGRSWTHTTIAHEIGHMLGLGDEYQTISGKTDCLPTSLMCSSSNGKLMPHHYYFVLRRLVQP